MKNDVRSITRKKWKIIINFFKVIFLYEDTLKVQFKELFVILILCIRCCFVRCVGTRIYRHRRLEEKGARPQVGKIERKIFISKIKGGGGFYLGSQFHYECSVNCALFGHHRSRNRFFEICLINCPNKLGALLLVAGASRTLRRAVLMPQCN